MTETTLPTALAVAEDTLASLTAKLRDAVTVTDAVAIAADATKACALATDLMAGANVALHWSNRFTGLRLRAMRSIGELLAGMEKNRGGNPNNLTQARENAAPTLKEIGISYNYSSECQRIARMPLEAFESYLAKGEAATADDNAEPTGLYVYAPHHADYQPVELRKNELLAIARHIEHTEAEKARRAAEKRERQDDVIRRAEAIGDGAPDPEPEIDLSQKHEPPPPPPEPPPPPPRPASNRIKGLLRTAVDPSASEHERAAAVAAVQRVDPRLETLDDETPGTAESAKSTLRVLNEMKYEGARIDHEQYSKIYGENQTLRKEVERLRKRDRDQVQTIRELRQHIAEFEAEEAAAASVPPFKFEPGMVRVSGFAADDTLAEYPLLSDDPDAETWAVFVLMEVREPHEADAWVTYGFYAAADHAEDVGDEIRAWPLADRLALIHHVTIDERPAAGSAFTSACVSVA